ncbi:CRISPR-associated helicase/endonuclease Cas3 [Bacillus luti]|nr:CRISPR-associated helicase Cas3' [Bacillus cereus]HDR8328202.1 CRISPR-associated helicase Cas3' [Bacillus cereus]HDR8335992.1 CRISPR-associated helicase Cas3' [Bacillus cereus]
MMMVTWCYSMDEIYAKSQPVETLREHTDALFSCFKELRSAYPNALQEKEWGLLQIVAEYHDVGKVLPAFQNRLIGDKGKPWLEAEVPHAIASLLFLPPLELPKAEKKIVMQSIAYHHERKMDLKKLNPVINEIAMARDKLIPVLEQNGFRVSDNITAKNIRRTIEVRYVPTHEDFLSYVRVKGMQHRLDYAASAREPIEMHCDKDLNGYVKRFFQAINGQPNPLQQFTNDNKEENIIAIAQTGMGKTEAAFLWLGEDKSFFTLPFKVSLDAQYERCKGKLGLVDENGPIAGLLHSGAIPVLENAYGEYDAEMAYNQAKLLSRKLTFCTVDQIMKFPLMFRGFEKWLATLGYSKVVIDEIQAYSPKMLAIILKGIQMIHEIGGRFCIMTATMPPVILEGLKQLGVTEKDYKKDQFVNDGLVRHRITVVEKPIYDDIDLIVEKSKAERVLVICNTVKRAIEVSNLIRSKGGEATLLHSAFIRRDRRIKENGILAFAPNDKNREKKQGIWITTQLVEASVDVDFDVLFSEIATLDSLFQRFGRVYRSRMYGDANPNVFIYTGDASGVGVHRFAVYEEELVSRGKELIQQFEGEILLESKKMEMIEILYDVEALKGTRYWREFQTALSVMEDISAYGMGSVEAQSIFREMDAVTGIPIQFKSDAGLIEQIRLFMSVQQQIKDGLGGLNQEKIQELRALKRRILLKIEDYTLSIARTKLGEEEDCLLVKGLDYIHWIHMEYNEEFGLH